MIHRVRPVMPVSKKRALKKKSNVRAIPAKEPGDKTQYLSRAVAKSLEILELLQGPLALNEVARQIRLSKTSAFRLLCTLESRGYLSQDAAGRYNLAPEIQRVVTSRFLNRLLDIAAPHMSHLCRGLRETINLAAVFENRIEAIAVKESAEPVRMSNAVGHIVPPNASSLGKIIASWLPAEKREKLLRSYGIYRFTPHTITDRADLDRELELARTRGYAADREESVADGYCFAVPIFAKNGDIAAALGVSLPKYRMRNQEQERRYVEALKAAAFAISAAL